MNLDKIEKNARMALSREEHWPWDQCGNQLAALKCQLLITLRLISKMRKEDGMGWSGHELPTKGWYLYTRGGSGGVYVQKQGPGGELLSEEVKIPSDMLRMLVAEDIRSKKISDLEQMEEDDILKMV